LSAPRRVVVTGGSRGIGRAVAEALAERGVRLLLLARSREALAQTCAELAGEEHEAVALDVADKTAWRRLAPRLGDVDGLVCAAAMLDPVGPVGTYSVEGFQRTLDVNVTGTLQAIVSCLPALRANKGSIVTFSGGGGTAPLPRFAAYAASKAAVVRLTETIALELAADGVRANCVAPGFVATEMHRATLVAGPDRAGAEYFERTRAELDRGGVPASEAAELVCRLLQHEPGAAFTGKLVSAQWDDWRDLGFRRRLAAERDLATLRRIDDTLFGRIGDS